MSAKRIIRGVSAWFTEWDCATLRVPPIVSFMARALSAAWLALFAALLVGAIVSPAYTQSFGVRVETRDGTAHDVFSMGEKRAGTLHVGLVKVSAVRVRAYAWNGGRPPFKAAAAQAAENVPLNGMAVGCPPGWEPEWAAERGFVRWGVQYQGMDVWTCVSSSQAWPRPAPTSFDSAGRPGPRTYPPGMLGPWIEGGDAIYVDLVPTAKSPDGAPLDLPDRDGPLARELLRFAEHSGLDVSGWPRLAAHRAGWTISPASYDAATPPGEQDLGWLLLHTHQRYASNADGSTRIPPLTGYYHWGTTGDAADGPTNARYDPALYCLLRYVVTGDPGSWRLARLLATQKVATGIAKTDAYEPEVSWRCDYEKGHLLSEATPTVARGGELGTTGSSLPARHSHQWLAGTWWAVAMAGDQHLLGIMDRAGQELLVPDVKWWAYGGRGLAWRLRNLRAAWSITKQQKYRDAATRSVGAVFTGPEALRPSEPSFVDRVSPGFWYPWQDYLLGGEMEAWDRLEGVGQEHAARRSSCVDWSLDNGLRWVSTPIGPCVQTAVSLGTASTATNWGPPALTAFALPVLASAQLRDPVKYRALYEGAVRTVTQGINQNWSAGSKFGVDPLPASEQGIAPTGYGFATLKVQLETSYGTTDWALKHATR